MNQGKEALSERKKIILKAVIDAHIRGGEPVGSKCVLENRQLHCSSATVRNEMAELEKMGYLEQPHTSAGRVPSELGYRFYVDSLIDSYAMTTKEIMQINNLLKIKMSELDQILVTASKLASTLTNYTGIAIRPKTDSVSFHRFDTVYIDEYHFLLIMMNGTSLVKTKKVRTNFKIDKSVIMLLGNSLNENLSDLTASDITLPIMMKMEKSMQAHSELVSVAVKAIYDVMSELDLGELKLSGINHLLDYPEYSDSKQLGELISALESKDEILNLVDKKSAASKAGDADVQVVIGSESSVKVMNQSAIVYKAIKKDGKTVGAIGIIGPLRMDYAKVLATLDSLGGNISSLLQGGAPPGNEAKPSSETKPGSEAKPGIEAKPSGDGKT